MQFSIKLSNEELRKANISCNSGRKNSCVEYDSKGLLKSIKDNKEEVKSRISKNLRLSGIDIE